MVPGEGHGLAFRALSDDAKELLQNLGLKMIFLSVIPSDRGILPMSQGLRLPFRLIHVSLNTHEMAHGLLSDLEDLTKGETALQMADWRNLAALGVISEEK